MDTFSLDQIAIKATGIVGRYWYGALDAKVLRQYVDSLFPDFAKDAVADNLKGQWHRWKNGHDLLTDVGAKLFSDPEAAIHRAGHILLTDFPTKAGIPIPGFSANGIGQILADCGINKGYMCLNIADGTVGIMAISESHADLLMALNGGSLDGWSFFDTYVEGGLEIWAGVKTFNPLLIAAGFENVTAGIFTTYDALTVTIEEFFGAALGGSLLGLGVSLLLWRNRPGEERIRKAIFTGTRAAILGGAGAISPFLSLGLAAGFCFHELCKSIIDGKPRVHEYEPGIFKVMLESSMESPSFREAWEAYATCQRSIEELTAKQASEIQGHLASSMEALSSLLNSMAPELPAATLPVDAKDDITAMLNKQQEDIEQLINRSTT